MAKFVVLSGYTGNGWTCSLTGFSPDQKVEITYSNKSDQHYNTDIGGDYLNDSWGNEAMTPATTKGGKLNSASL
jgi:hypothetical protein